jgi:DNA-binding MarR family transcriptional regulator
MCGKEMPKGLADFERYVRDVLAVRVSAAPWAEGAKMPFFLRNLYSFFEIRIMDAPFLVMLDSGKEELSPAVVGKHMAQVRLHWDGEIVYVRERVTAYNRKRLIEHKIPFVVPGNQMYLPMLGIDLREHFRALRSPTPRFTPATQAVVIQILLDKLPRNRLTPAAAAHEVGYTPMTMTRVFDELESANLVAILTDGRQRFLDVQDPLKEFWGKALPYLHSPVKKRIHARLATDVLPGPLAGLSALVDYSNLAEPANPVIAVSQEKWKTLKTQHRVSELPVAESDAIEIEVWSYSPHRLADSRNVDRFSLYLSLKGDPDERVEAALEEMMAGVPW